MGTISTDLNTHRWLLKIIYVMIPKLSKPAVHLVSSYKMQDKKFISLKFSSYTQLDYHNGC